MTEDRELNKVLIMQLEDQNRSIDFLIKLCTERRQKIIFLEEELTLERKKKKNEEIIDVNDIPGDSVHGSEPVLSSDGCTGPSKSDAGT